MDDQFREVAANNANVIGNSGQALVFAIEDRLAGVGRTNYKIFALQPQGVPRVMYDAGARLALAACGIGVRYDLDGNGTDLLVPEQPQGPSCSSRGGGRLLAADIPSGSLIEVTSSTFPFDTLNLSVSADHHEAVIPLLDQFGQDTTQLLFLSRQGGTTAVATKVADSGIFRRAVVGGPVGSGPLLFRRAQTVVARLWGMPARGGAVSLFEVVPATGAATLVFTPGNPSSPTDFEHGPMDDGRSFQSNRLVNLFGQPVVQSGPSLSQMMCTSLTASQYYFSLLGEPAPGDAEAARQRDFSCDVSNPTNGREFEPLLVRADGRLLVRSAGAYLSVHLQADAVSEVAILPGPAVPRSNGTPVEIFGTSSDGRMAVFKTARGTQTRLTQDFHVFDTRTWRRIK